MKTEKMILGQDCVFSTDCEETNLNNNILVCGGSGSGKTMSIVEPILLETFSSSLVVTVTKRRIVDMYTPLFLERGYRVVDLNLADMAGSRYFYDPMDDVRSEHDIVDLARRIVCAKGTDWRGDPYWDETAIDLLSAEIALIWQNDWFDKSMRSVMEFHSSMQFRPSRNHFAIEENQWFQDMDPDTMAAQRWSTFSKNSEKTARCIYSVVSSALNNFFNPDLFEDLELKSRMNFDELVDRKTIVWITVDPADATTQRLTNLIYEYAIQRLFALGERECFGKLPIPVRFVFDDFATASTLESFPRMISVIREKGISATILLQSESQLVAMYGAGDAQTIINNCDTYVYLGGMDLDTAKNVSQRLLLPLKDVLYMPIGLEYVFRRGMYPMVVERYRIRDNVLWQATKARYECAEIEYCM